MLKNAYYVYFFVQKSIALLHLLHIAIVFWGVNYCILQYSIAFLAAIAIAIAIVLMAIANALIENKLFNRMALYMQNKRIKEANFYLRITKL